MNLGVVGSQIVGLVPLEAVIAAADHYMEKDNLFILEEDQKLRLVSCHPLIKHYLSTSRFGKVNFNNSNTSCKPVHLGRKIL